MRKSTASRVTAILAVAGALALSAGTPAMAAGPKAYTCSGGAISSGNYSSIKVTGACSVAADAVINVGGNVTVAPGAVFDAQSAPSTIRVGGSVTGGAGSLVGLGCQPPSYTGNSAHTCAVEPEGHSTITVGGNVTVTDAAAVLLNGIKVGGSVTLRGGGSTVPWSIKNNKIGGNLAVSGQRTEWLGVLFNKVGGSVRLTDIALSDSHPGAPGVYIVQNRIGGNLSCTGLTPGVSGGFVPGAVNVVGGRATGQCASLV